MHRRECFWCNIFNNIGWHSFPVVAELLVDHLWQTTHNSVTKLCSYYYNLSVTLGNLQRNPMPKTRLWFYHRDNYVYVYFRHNGNRWTSDRVCSFHCVYRYNRQHLARLLSQNQREVRRFYARSLFHFSARLCSLHRWLILDTNFWLYLHAVNVEGVFFDVLGLLTKFTATVHTCGFLAAIPCTHYKIWIIKHNRKVLLSDFSVE